MHILLIILLCIVGLVALLLIIALFTKKGYNVYREISIDRPRDAVFNYVRHLVNQEQYSKWVMTDPDMKKTLTGTDGQVGFVYAWDGNARAGKGEQEIMQIIDGRKLDVQVRFERPFKAVASTPFTLEDLPGNQTRLKWGMDSNMNYPMNIVMLFMNMDKTLGKDLEISLGNLKRILETGK